MKWSKTGKNYSVSSDGNKTTFNLDGTVVKQNTTSQEDANSFLQINGFQPFKVDEKVSSRQVSQKINGKLEGSNLKKYLTD